MNKPFDGGDLTAAEHLEAALQHLLGMGVPAGACELRVTFNEHGRVRDATLSHWSWSRRHAFGRTQLDLEPKVA